jgi:hypothetical protein
MVNTVNSNTLFDEMGRRFPFDGMRVFNEVSSWYYKIQQPQDSFENILSRSKKFSGVDKSISTELFESICMGLKQKAMSEPSLECLFKGVHVPFICPQSSGEPDLGIELEKITLPSVANSFKAAFPELHFKATLQGSSKLSGELSVVKGSRYEQFLELQKDGAVAGWYFPQALQEYDITSQRKQMDSLPLPNDLVLSGGTDTAGALIGSPGLLINKEHYPPVLCLSALKHADEKVMLCFKAYGHHLEFWCMSQMLTPSLTQVSEQWSGGLTLFSSF